MLLIEILIASLATWEAVEIWHHSAITAEWRARVELMEGALRSLLTCPFCTAPWVAWFFAALMLCVRYWLGLETGWPILLPIYGLAVARLANLGNDVTHIWCRTPKADKEIPDTPAGDELKSTF